MKQDIRKLFKSDRFENKTLPENHREQFLEKLNVSKTKNVRGLSLRVFLKIAASIVLLFSVSYYLLIHQPDKVKRQSSLELQVEQIEEQYLEEIDDEWQKFIKATDDKLLIDKYKEKLNDLDYRYKELSKSFKKNTNNVMVLEDLISNLQNRLQLLKDIQNHIKTLNENKKTHETIIL